MIKIFIASLLFSLVSPASAATQEESIGFVKKAEGEASVITAANTVKAEPGVPVYLGSVLKTGDQGALGVTFKDNTVMSFGPDTQVTVDEYLFAPARGNLKLVANIAQGTLHYISGVIAKLKPEAVAVKTPTGMIGVRGTRFVAKVEAE
jgi:hypothetical protein